MGREHSSALKAQIDQVPRRFWFKFAPFGYPTPLNLGCSVTAHDLDDALRLIKERVFRVRRCQKYWRLSRTLILRHLIKGTSFRTCDL